MALINVVSVGAMFLRRDPAVQLLIIWLDLIAIAACLVYVHSRSNEQPREALDSLTNTPAVSRSATSTNKLSSTQGETIPDQRIASQTASLDEFPSERDLDRERAS